MPAQKPLTSFLVPWGILGLTIVAVLFQFLLQTSVSVMIEDLSRAFNANLLQVSLISASFFYTYIFLQIPAGMLFDKFAAGKVFALSLIGVAVTCLLFAHAQNLTVSILSRSVMGIFCAAIFPGALYIATNLFPAQRFALVVGITEMFGMAGAALGERFMAIWVSGHGWRTTIVACACSALCLAMVLYVVHTLYNKRYRKSDVQLSRQDLPGNRLKLVLQMPQAWLCGLYSGLMFAIMATFAALWCVPYLLKVYSVNLTQAASASGLIFLGVGLASPLCGWFSDKIKRRKPILLISASLTFLLLAVIFYVPNLAFSHIKLLLFSLGFASCGYALPFAIAREIAPSHSRGAMLGFINMWSIAIGAPLLQPLIGWLINQPSQYAAIPAYAISHYQHVIGNSLLACALSALILAFGIKETYCCEHSN
jgi:MFS family permease